MIKTFLALGYPDFTAAHPILGLVVTVIGAVALALLLASPPVRRVLEPLTNPLGTLEKRRAARRERHGSATGTAPTSG